MSPTTRITQFITPKANVIRTIFSKPFNPHSTSVHFGRARIALMTFYSIMHGHLLVVLRSTENSGLHDLITRVNELLEEGCTATLLSLYTNDVRNPPGTSSKNLEPI
jgi:hypothetical protein